MRLNKALFLTILLLFTVACQCTAPSLLTSLLQGQATPQAGLLPEEATPQKVVTETVFTETVITEPVQPSLTREPNLLNRETPPAAVDTDTPKTRTYDIVESIKLTNDGDGSASRVVIWVALIQTIAPYQTVEAFSSSHSFTTVTDEYGNQYAEIELQDVRPGESQVLDFSYQVTVNEIRADLGSCSGSSIDMYLNDETYIESDSSEIINLAGSIRQDGMDECQTARALYDYVGDHITYSNYSPLDVGALTALEEGAGDCTEFSDTLIALNRAAGIPANFVEGVVCCTENGYTPGDVRHDWSEIYLPGSGWVPVDATFGRAPMQRNLYFAALPADRIIVTRGRNLTQLDGYHYFYFRYWWDFDAASITPVETWSILPADR